MSASPHEPGSKPTTNVAVFGVINAGKSSLINALTNANERITSPVGGTTRAVEPTVWRDLNAEGSGVAHLIRLVDTPGIEEVDDVELGREAIAAAESADLVLFVIAEDLTDTSLSALNRLRRIGKPMIVALNKVDLLDLEQVEEVADGVRRRLDGIVPESDVIPTAAAPLVREREVQADGSSRLVVRREAPRVSQLEARLVSALIESAEDLRELNEASRSVEELLAGREALKRERRAIAERVADETSIGLALALAVNPIPLVDFLTGSGGLVILVTRVAHAYGESPTRESARALAMELFKGGRKAFWGSVLGVFAGGALKLLPGVGHVAAALTQGASAGYVAYILGRALVDYHENGHDWGEGGLIANLERIATRTDRKALTRGLVDRLKARLGA